MNDRKITDLLYLQKEIDDKLFSEISLVLSNCANTVDEIKESLFYIIEKRLDYMRLDEEKCKQR